MRFHTVILAAFLSIDLPTFGEEARDQPDHWALLGERVAELETMATRLGSIETLGEFEESISYILDSRLRFERLDKKLAAMATPAPEQVAENRALIERDYELRRRIDDESRRIFAIPGIREAYDRECGKRAAEARCQAHLKTILLATHIHVERHGRAPAFGNPAFFAALREEDLHFPAPGEKPLFCPASPDLERDRESGTSYATWSGGDSRIVESIPQAAEAREFPVAWDRSPEHHAGRRVVVFGDGHASTLPEEEFQALVAEWETRGFTR